MSRESVTTDLAVLQGWPKPTKKKTHFTASEVATAMNLTVFQITARLKGMEGRGLIGRALDGEWALTDLGKTELANPSPSLVAKPKTARLASTNGSMVGPPDDSKVPRIDFKKMKWRPTAKTVEYARDTLPLLEHRLGELKEDPKRNRIDIMKLQTSVENAREILRKAKVKDTWSYRTDFRGSSGNFTVFIAPDGREYITARMFETADLITGSGLSQDKDTRLRLLMTSPTAKKLNKKQAELAAREQAKEQEKQDARQARVLAEEEAERERTEKRLKHAKAYGAGKRIQREIRSAASVRKPHKAEVKRGPAKADRAAPKGQQSVSTKPGRGSGSKGRLHTGGNRGGKSAQGRAKDGSRALHSRSVVRNDKKRK